MVCTFFVRLFVTKLGLLAARFTLYCAALCIKGNSCMQSCSLNSLARLQASFLARPKAGLLLEESVFIMDHLGPIASRRRCELR